MIRCETCLVALQIADREDNDCPDCKDYKGNIIMKRFIAKLREEMDRPSFTVGDTMNVDGISLMVTHIPITDENVIDDLRDIAIRIVDELVDEHLITRYSNEFTDDNDIDLQVQDIIHTHLLHNLADMDSPTVKEYIGEV